MTPTQNPADRTEILPLTGIRGVAAAWVLAFHAEKVGLWRAFPWPARSARLVQSAGSGYLGVDLFFLLSGFVLTWTYAERLRDLNRRDYGRYVVARVARVYPVHALVLAALVAMAAGASAGWWTSPFGPPEDPAGAVALHALMIHSWGFGPWLSWNHPAWSISAEWFAYLWFPFACGLLLRLRNVLVLGLGALAALAAVAVIAPRFALRPTLNAPQVCGLVRVTGAFLAGCLLCRAFVALRGRRVPWTAMSVAAAIAIVGLAAAGRADPFALPFFGLLVVSLAAGTGPLARVLSTPAAVLAGRVSYALYMVHWPVYVLLHDAGAPAEGAAWTLGACLAWTALHAGLPLVLAWGLWRWVEEPSRRAIRRAADGSGKNC